MWTYFLFVNDVQTETRWKPATAQFIFDLLCNCNLCVTMPE